MKLCDKVGVSNIDLSHKKCEVDFAMQAFRQEKIPKDLIQNIESKGLNNVLTKGKSR
ncbi:hypothetical protein [Helicobacter sp. T3_23-1056]